MYYLSIVHNLYLYIYTIEYGEITRLQNINNRTGQSSWQVADVGNNHGKQGKRGRYGCVVRATYTGWHIFLIH